MRLVILALLLICVSINTKASILIEPYLNYLTGSSKFEGSNSGILNGDYVYSETGTNYGIKLGGTFDPIFFGASYELGNLKRKIDKVPREGITVNPSSNKIDTTLLGIIIGAKIPFLRFWGSYYIDSEWKYKDGSDPGAKDTVGGFGLGLGFTGLPFMSINLEYRSLEVKEHKNTSGVVTKYPTSTVSGQKYSDFLIGVSIPLEFL
ncbi:MAG: hypothetical protein COW00_18645 [Bdellovibrio sp. CG12_big_fil_rev_8_21_14_0_65_39_13]|nr:MAG: hypothetical protein COW78_15080 [Bdellovibrio sp. CG22_combo_CG10-13_8_21_14_all_39_27]PIQ57857.1 MAG: hypothetical protein COW00_18645 [Bdellovibrio sp. CG12_big_fil_rev_8_21_14_0_65_39_13]PIR32491.1 MAG: hypothetical protein COV37_19645 [Bdellovibrio sp. CG11_big_fil_rev_8_21_14_0_20_39_38]